MRALVGCRNIAVLWAALLAGCATANHSVTRPLANVPSTGEAAVAVSDGGVASMQEADQLRAEIIQRLEGRRRFQNVSPFSEDRRPSQGVVISCRVTEISRVSAAARVLVGAFAGRASLGLHVTVTDSESRATLGEADVSGKSSAGSVFAGTTDQAIQMAADGVADFVSPAK